MLDLQAAAMMNGCHLSLAAARRLQRGLVDEGECGTMDEAAHYLVDCGEIDCATHEELLSKAERERVYG